MKFFSDPIWDSRLQAIWVSYAALYIFLGRVDNSILISSIAILLGGILVVAVFAHILVEPDRNKARATLLVALTASLFFAKESIDVYGDKLAGIFSILFAIQFFTLIVIADGSLRANLKYRFFSTMSLVLIASSLLLVITVLVKMILNLKSVGSGYYLSGPMGTGAFSGLAIAAITGNRLLPAALPNIVVPSSKLKITTLIAVAAYSFCMSFIVFEFNNIRLLEVFSSVQVSIMMSFFYLFTTISLPVIAYRKILQNEGQADRFSSVAIVILSCILVAIINTTMIAAGVQFFSDIDFNYLTRLIYVEGPTSLMLGVSLIIWQKMVRRVCRAALVTNEVNLN